MILLLLINPIVQAKNLQLNFKNESDVFTVSNGDSISLESSDTYLNTITFNFDPIIVSLDTNYFKYNTKNKSVFFINNKRSSFAVVNSNGNIIINITTIPKNIPGKTYFINIPNLNIQEAINTEKASEYPKFIINLIDSIYKQNPLPGYSVIEQPDKYKIQIAPIKNLFMIPVLIYQGVRFSAIKIQINNLDSIKTKEIYEHEIYSKNIRAVVLTNNTIEPNSEIFAYIIYCKEEE